MSQPVNEYSWCRVLGRLVAAAGCGITGFRIRIYLQRAAFRKAACHGHMALDEIRNRTLGDKTFNGEDRLWLGPARGVGETWETINAYQDSDDEDSTEGEEDDEEGEEENENDEDEENEGDNESEEENVNGQG